MAMFGLGFRMTSSAVCLRMEVIDVIANYNWLCLIDGLRS
jgi:hypothetical protein